MAKVGTHIALFLWFATGCVTLKDSNKAELPPKLTKEMSVAQIVGAGVDHGGETLEQARKLIVAKKASAQANAEAEKIIRTGYESLDVKKVLNAVYFYQASISQPSPEIINLLIKANRPVIRQIGWHIAGRYPSKEMAEVVDKELTRAIFQSEEHKILIPEVAEAAYANSLSETYMLMRQGLMENGDPAFAEAMRLFAPRDAAYDFIDYLARATIEDLRQLNQTTVNMHTCALILRHLSYEDVSINHPKFEVLFLYAVSRNQILAELANDVLEKQMPGSQEHLAHRLSRLPAWIQVAFVEGTRKNFSPNVGTFLSQLKKITAHREVVEEIDTVIH